MLLAYRLACVAMLGFLVARAEVGRPRLRPATARPEPIGLRARLPQPLLVYPALLPLAAPALSAPFEPACGEPGARMPVAVVEFPRGELDAILADPMSVARQARIVPAIHDGHAHGFKLYAIRPDSVPARLGLQNGDTILTVGGDDMTSPDKALSTYSEIKAAKEVVVELERRGCPLALVVVFR